ncbi:MULTISPECIES: helix-turn-helix domain-containing protein [Gordonibacter]|uniref:Helix-turn-helix domain-containing protein n=1 Tax=Gordonibacter faecis TaxID=3047475 RepID=A0ABT7DPD4_9ACTN|nr:MULTISPECIES: helix-turn-helix domain-containing protein [unclassified Gordonibacter]MDJ1651400.1 helix-turn-helix domain-containing protein [Gordonibacter sp. KGMB12511]HIW75993.1 helix-turn-helix domain-containing protein [Candidatus Gordonibacter avicola]
MSIVLTFEKVIKDKGINEKEIAEKLGAIVDLPRIEAGNVRAIRFTTLDALCVELDCQPGDILFHAANK